MRAFLNGASVSSRRRARWEYRGFVGLSASVCGTATAFSNSSILTSGEGGTGSAVSVVSLAESLAVSRTVSFCMHGYSLRAAVGGRRKFRRRRGPDVHEEKCEVRRAGPDAYTAKAGMDGAEGLEGLRGNIAGGVVGTNSCEE